MEKVFKFLKENVVCTVATCSDNNPRASVLEYVMIGDSIIIATDMESVKANNLKGNNKISVSVHNMPLFVVIDGTAVTPDQGEIDGYNKVLFERHPEFVEFIEKGFMRPFVYYKIAPKVCCYSDFSQGMKPGEIINF